MGSVRGAQRVVKFGVTFFLTSISPWQRHVCVNWGSVTGRKKEEKNVMQLIARLSFQRLPCANANSRSSFFFFDETSCFEKKAFF